MEEVDKNHSLATEAVRSSYTPVKLRCIDFVYLLLCVTILVIALVLFSPATHDDDAKLRFFIQLVESWGLGLDPCAPKVRSPIFKLAMDVDRVSKWKHGPCTGGGDAMLRVSYRGIILAWGSVPRFCIVGPCLQVQGPSDNVVSVVATAEGFVLLEEVRNMIRAEANAFGSVEFYVEGSLPGLGHLRCKTYLFKGEPTKALQPCSRDTRVRREDF